MLFVPLNFHVLLSATKRLRRREQDRRGRPRLRHRPSTRARDDDRGRRRPLELGVHLVPVTPVDGARVEQEPRLRALLPERRRARRLSPATGLVHGVRRRKRDLLDLVPHLADAAAGVVTEEGDPPRPRDLDAVARAPRERPADSARERRSALLPRAFRDACPRGHLERGGDAAIAVHAVPIPSSGSRGVAREPQPEVPASGDPPFALRVAAARGAHRAREQALLAASDAERVRPRCERQLRAHRLLPGGFAFAVLLDRLVDELRPRFIGRPPPGGDRSLACGRRVDQEAQEPAEGLLDVEAPGPREVLPAGHRDRRRASNVGSLPDAEPPAVVDRRVVRLRPVDLDRLELRVGPDLAAELRDDADLRHLRLDHGTALELLDLDRAVVVVGALDDALRGRARFDLQPLSGAEPQVDGDPHCASARSRDRDRKRHRRAVRACPHRRLHPRAAAEVLPEAL